MNGSAEEDYTADSNILALSGAKCSLFSLEAAVVDEEMSNPWPSGMEDETMVARKLLRTLQSN